MEKNLAEAVQVQGVILNQICGQNLVSDVTVVDVDLIADGKLVGPVTERVLLKIFIFTTFSEVMDAKFRYKDVET